MSVPDHSGECLENAASRKHSDGVLVCTLDDGHNGPHHDTFDHVLWEEDADSWELRYWPDGEARP
jgi:hypothetical protein